MTFDELFAETTELCKDLHREPSCKICGKWDRGYSVKEEVWLEVQPSLRSGFLCLLCFEELLGRPLCVEDFIPAPINYTLFFGYLIGKRSNQ